jgi:hypothetical protein
MDTVRLTIVFSTTQMFLSRIIRWATRSRASHVLIGSELHGIPIVIEASVGGVRILHRDHAVGPSTLVSEYVIVSDRSSDIARAVERLGDKYNYAGLILGFPIVLLARWLGKKIKNPLRSPHEEVCAEFVTEVFSDIPAFAKLDPSVTTPEDLIEACEKSADFLKIS